MRLLRCWTGLTTLHASPKHRRLRARLNVVPGVSTRRRFRSTTPGLVTRSTARPEGVHLIDRIEAADGGDPLTSPLQATALHGLRRALAIALAMGEQFSDASGLADLKRSNLAGALSADRKAEFTDLLTAEALTVAHVWPMPPPSC